MVYSSKNRTGTNLEDNEILIAGPNHVGIQGTLLGVPGYPRIDSLVDVLDEHVVQSLKTLLIVVLVEASEDNLDVFIQKKIHGGAPELSFKSGMNGHHNIWLLNLFGLDKSKIKSKMLFQN